MLAVSKGLRGIVRSLLLLVVVIAAGQPALAANVLTPLHAFAQDNYGSSPEGVVVDANGDMYGVTEFGGPFSCGMLFKVTPAGVETTLHVFSGSGSPVGVDGCQPLTTLLLGQDGYLYGSTFGTQRTDCKAPGCQLIFRIATDGSGYSILHVFSEANDGSLFAPYGLMQGSDGRLYGAAAGGGAGNAGGVYAMATDGSGFAVVHAFAGGTDASTPVAPPTQGADGVLYGTTNNGGGSGCFNQGCGTVYKVGVDGTGYAVLHQFGGDGDLSHPDASVIQGSDGALYLTASQGGNTSCPDSGGAGCGGVAKLHVDGSGYALLHVFAGGTDGGVPASALLRFTDGRLYGTAFSGGSTACGGGGCGIVFSLAADGSDYAAVHAFSDTADGVIYPNSVLVPGAGGKLYGTTVNSSSPGCNGNGCGAVFSVTTGGTVAAVTVFGTSQDGYFPVSKLLLGADGALYGAAFSGGGGNCYDPRTSGTSANGCGMLFRVMPDGSQYASLHSFTNAAADGAFPNALAQNGSGALIGTFAGMSQASICGAGSCGGGVFSMAADGSGFTVLHGFPLEGTDGSGSRAPVLIGNDGRLYGTNYDGGMFVCPSSFCGTVFAMNADGSSETLLHTFVGGTDGAYPASALIQGQDGKLYGTTAGGGDGLAGVQPGDGTLFSMDVDGSNLTILHTFSDTADGFDPVAALVQGGDGMLYGTTSAGNGSGGCQFVVFTTCGTVFKIAPDGSGYTILHTFGTVATDGREPSADLIFGDDGLLYGTTAAGGGTACGGSGCGTLFKIATDGSGYALLYAFTGGNDGAVPMAGLQQTGGSLFGSTRYGGAYGAGTVFRYGPAVSNSSSSSSSSGGGSSSSSSSGGSSGSSSSSSSGSSSGSSSSGTGSSGSSSGSYGGSSSGGSGSGGGGAFNPALMITLWLIAGLRRRRNIGR